MLLSVKLCTDSEYRKIRVRKPFFVPSAQKSCAEIVDQRLAVTKDGKWN